MHSRPLQETDLETILPWWLVRGEGDMPPDILPPIAAVACDEDGPVAAAWLYEPHGCRVAIVDWLVTRPGLRPAYTRAACRLVLDFLTIHASARGARVIFASVTRRGALREAEAAGFQVCATACTHLVKHLP